MEPLPYRGEIFFGNGNMYYDRWIGAICLQFGDEMNFEELRQLYPNTPVGVKIALPYSEEISHEIIENFKDEIEEVAGSDADFIYLDVQNNFELIRLLVVSAHDISAKNLVVSLHVGEEKRMLDGTDILAGISTLEAIGVGMFVLSSDENKHISEATKYVSRYIKGNLCIKIPEESFFDPEFETWNVDMYLPPNSAENEQFLQTYMKFDGAKFVDKDYDDEDILCSDGMNMHFISANIDISEEIACTLRFPEDILEMEDNESGAIKIEISDEDELCVFEEFQYMLTRPICILAYDEEILEKALKIFKGRAIYDGTYKLNESFLKYLEKKYGLIIL